MSRTEPRGFEQAELMFACAFCDADVGEWCRNESGAKAGKFVSHNHANRWDRVNEIVRLTGWIDDVDSLRAESRRLRDGLRALLNDDEWGDEAWIRIRLREVLHP